MLKVVSFLGIFGFFVIVALFTSISLVRGKDLSTEDAAFCAGIKITGVNDNKGSLRLDYSTPPKAVDESVLVGDYEVSSPETQSSSIATIQTNNSPIKAGPATFQSTQFTYSQFQALFQSSNSSNSIAITYSPQILRGPLVDNSGNDSFKPDITTCPQVTQLATKTTSGFQFLPPKQGQVVTDQSKKEAAAFTEAQQQTQQQTQSQTQDPANPVLAQLNLNPEENITTNPLVGAGIPCDPTTGKTVSFPKKTETPGQVVNRPGIVKVRDDFTAPPGQTVTRPGSNNSSSANPPGQTVSRPGTPSDQRSGQEQYSDAIASLPKGVMTAIGCVPTEPKAFVEGILKFVTFAGGGVAFILMLLASLELITAEGNAELLNKAREKFYSGL